MIILASKSPRRIELMQKARLKFIVQTAGEIAETYPPELQREEISLFLARKKASAFLQVVNITDNTILVTADTVVWINNCALGKPADRKEAIDMLAALSGNMHQVYTGVCLTTNRKQHAFYDESKVYFKKLTVAEISFYVDRFKPFDKAGAYGIQEWIGLIGIEKIEGSYHNIVGLPIQKLYAALSNFARDSSKTDERKKEEIHQKSKERLKELRTWAKENLLGKEVYHPDFSEKIHFSSTGIKEFLNQPHKDYHAKNELIKEIHTIIPKSKLVDNAPDIHGDTNKHFYYLETEILEQSSYIVIRHTRKDNQYTLYSMVDKIRNR